MEPALQALTALLRIESDIRSIKTINELLHLATNETRALVRARQVFILKQDARKRLHVVAASSLSSIDATAPLIRWIERSVARGVKTLSNAQALHAAEFDQALDPTGAAYPFRQIIWMPLWSRHGPPTAGFLLARETPWTDADQTIAARLATTVGHAWALLQSPQPLRQRMNVPRRWPQIVGLLALMALAIPVPLTALAPVEIVPQAPVTITMPIDGQVQEVLVMPSTPVTAGTPLIKLLDTIWRNKLELAVRDVVVAEARAAKAHQLALTDPRGRHELGIARAELALRAAERDFARDMAEQLTIRAPSDGIVLFNDKKDLTGRPFSTGDKLMEIADPAKLELKADLAVSDSLLLLPGARLKAFLDTAPLSPVEARVTRFDYQARVNEARIAVHRIFAEYQQETFAGEVRIGARGTAQLYGPKVSLGYLVFRRPLTALRQWTGL